MALDTSWLIGTLIGVVALGFTVTFLFVNYTYKKKTDIKADNRLDSALILKLAQDTKHDQEELAKKVKEEVHEYVRHEIDIIKLRIDNEVKIGYAKFDLISERINSWGKEIDNVRDSERENTIRLEKSIYFLQQFQWGKDAKSIAPYTIGEEESQEHKEETGTGIFAPTEEELEETRLTGKTTEYKAAAKEKEERERERERQIERERSMNKYDKDDN